MHCDENDVCEISLPGLTKVYVHVPPPFNVKLSLTNFFATMSSQSNL